MFPQLKNVSRNIQKKTDRWNFRICFRFQPLTQSAHTGVSAKPSFSISTNKPISSLASGVSHCAFVRITVFDFRKRGVCWSVGRGCRSLLPSVAGCSAETCAELARHRHKKSPPRLTAFGAGNDGGNSVETFSACEAGIKIFVPSHNADTARCCYPL